MSNETQDRTKECAECSWDFGEEDGRCACTYRFNTEVADNLSKEIIIKDKIYEKRNKN